MIASNQYREKAIEYSKRADVADSTNQQLEYRELQRHFSELADIAQWLHRDQQRTEHDYAGVSVDKLDGETVKHVIHACDDAWRSLRGSIFTAVPRAIETREYLVRHIIQLAQLGERDAGRLTDSALRDFELHCSGTQRRSDEAHR